MTPFKDSAFYKALKTTAPHLIDIFESFAPAPVKGALDIVKNIVFKDTALNDQQKATLAKAADDYELQLIQSDATDRASARDREIAVTNATKKRDIIIVALSILGVVIPIGLVIYLIYTEKQVGELVAGFTGVIIGSYTQVFNYFFGSSQSSKNAQEVLTQIAKS